MFDFDGLLYVPDYLTPGQQDELVQRIDQQPWRLDIARRTQQYGYIYEHRAGALNVSLYLGELPEWLQRIGDRMLQDGLVPEMPDQAILNEYEPGQGIGGHVDAPASFGEVVVSLSLLSPVVMDMRRGEQHVPMLVQPRSLLVLHGEARYEWTHGIAYRKSDTYNGQVIPRARRISVTFRKVTTG